MIERYTFHERICHWLTGFAYTYCLMTGLALYTPYLFWMAVILGGGPVSRFWHPWVGVAFVAAAVWMHALWRGDMVLSDADKRWLDSTKQYATNQDASLPPQGRFNAGQKVFYWLMYYGAIVLLISGLVMWFPELVPFSWRAIRPIFVILHECAALVTIGAFILHIYMGLFFVPGSLDGMLFGRVSRQWAKAHHRLWFEHATGETSRKEPLV